MKPGRGTSLPDRASRSTRGQEPRLLVRRFPRQFRSTVHWPRKSSRLSDAPAVGGGEALARVSEPLYWRFSPPLHTKGPMARTVHMCISAVLE